MFTIHLYLYIAPTQPPHKTVREVAPWQLRQPDQPQTRVPYSWNESKCNGGGDHDWFESFCVKCSAPRMVRGK
jgi:hypothetical protein